MELNGYVCVNEDKLQRAIHGSVTDKGQLIGGVGEEASDAVKLAAYDRLGGLIKNKQGYKVRTGSFCDLKASKGQVMPVVIEEPVVMLEFRVSGELISFEEGKDIPLDVKAAEFVEKKRKAKKAKK